MTFIQRFRIFALALGLTFSLGVAVTPVMAADGLGGALSGGLQKAAPKELQGASDLNVIIGNLISTVIGFLGVVLFVYLLYGGFIYMTAGGDTKKVTTATDIIRNAVIGLVIIASAYAIANFVINSLATATGGAPVEQQNP